MKSLYLPMCAAMMAAALPFAPLSAQSEEGRKAPRPTIEERLSRMKEKLSLTDDQVAKLRAIFEEQKMRIDPIWQDASLTPEQKREKIHPISVEMHTKVDGVLTPEQKMKLDEIRKAKHGKKGDQ